MEIVIRAAVMFVFLWAVTRAVGRSTLGELSTFERFPSTRSMINGKPLVIVRDGEILPTPVRQQRLSTTDLLATARQQGIRSISDVELAVLEADGKVSFFTRTDHEGAPETGISS
jgi:uncharacterized membrane protein YcaP (DUF421 family)